MTRQQWHSKKTGTLNYGICGKRENCGQNSCLVLAWYVFWTFLIGVQPCVAKEAESKRARKGMGGSRQCFSFQASYVVEIPLTMAIVILYWQEEQYMTNH